MVERDPFELLSRIAEEEEHPGDAFGDRLFDDLLADLRRDADPFPRDDIPPTATPGSTGPPPLPDRLTRIYADQGGDPNTNPSVNQQFTGGAPVTPVEAGTYGLGLPVAGSITIGTVDELPDGIAFTGQLDSGDLSRKLFFPAAETGQDYVATIEPFSSRTIDPDTRGDSSIFLSPFFEIVHLPTLGATAAEVTSTIVESDLTMLDTPTDGEFAGLPATVIDAVAERTLVVASGAVPDAVRQVLPAWRYQSEARVRMHVVEVGDIVLVAVVSTTEVGFDAWAAVADQYLAGVSFG